MQTKIDKLNKLLESNPKFAVDIYDPLKSDIEEDYLDRNVNIEAILKNYSNPTEYYKSFYHKGFNEIGIILKKKNGSSWFKNHLPITISFTTAQDNQTPNPQNEKNSDNMLVESLGGGKASKGLSLDDYIDLNYTKKDHEKLIDKYSKLEAEHKSEKKKRKKYQKLFEKASTTSFLETETGKKTIGLVETLGMAFIEKHASTTALAGGNQQQPQPTILNNLSEDKKAFVKEVLSNPNLEDSILKNLSLTAVGLQNSDSFSSALDLLLDEYELKS